MKRLLLLIFTSAFLSAMAQTESDPFGSSYNYDSTSFTDSSFSGETTMSESNDEMQAPTYKKYVRFKAPIDTITDLGLGGADILTVASGATANATLRATRN